MDKEIARLRKKLKDAQDRLSEERRLREEAEERVKPLEPLTLPGYLEGCHSLSLTIQVVTDPTCTTQGDAAKPAGRRFPGRIVPWDDFPMMQEEIWDQISDDSFCSRPMFPSSHQLDYVASVLKPINSEMELRHFERNTVENAVEILMKEAYNSRPLRKILGLQGTVVFESHTNLGDDDAYSKYMEYMSIDDSAGASASAPKTPKPKTRRKARGTGGMADQFCIYRTCDGQNIPVLAVEYKAPHKLTRDEIVTGLEFEIQPECDVIDKECDGFVFASKWLTAAVVTQLFSYMIGKSVQYGYVCTGEALIFLYIPDDPVIVYYSVCIPNLDVQDDNETRLYYTAVAQVFAFLLRALQAEPPPPSWHDKTEDLGIWPVEFMDVLKKIPESVLKEPKATPYKPQRWKGFKRSPIQTRARCRQLNINVSHMTDDDEEDPSPTAGPSTCSGKKPIGPGVTSGAASGTTDSRGKQQRSGGDGQQGQGKQKIQNRSFCTQKCLLGLAHGGPTDKDCPNFYHHGPRHIDRLEFLRLMRDQLAKDRGPDVDCVPLYLSGARGSLFKVRLSSHGYTLVAKGVEECDLGCLSHESQVYDQLKTIQGKHVPVCIGRINLVLPHYYNSGVYVHFLFLSWAGRPLFQCIDQDSRAGIADAVTTAFKELHRLYVLHRDAEPRNLVYDTCTRSLMIVDFERAEVRERQPLDPISPNKQGQGRKHASRKQGKDDFAIELESVASRVLRLAPSSARVL